MERSKPVIIEQHFNRSVNDVWSAITQIDHMTQWFFENIPTFEAKVGFETSFNVNANGVDYLHLWKITEVIPQKKITYSWKYRDFKGDGVVIFELFEETDQTLLKLTNHGLETFPDDIPEFTRESCEAGWNYFINQRLKEYLS